MTKLESLASLEVAEEPPVATQLPEYELLTNNLAPSLLRQRPSYY